MIGKAARTTAGVATLGFVVTFAAIRALTYSIHVGFGPFHDVSAGGTHIHHMVWGILLLLAAGYFRLLNDRHGVRRMSGWVGWLTAAAYGVGAALTLDESALWFNMRDVYWRLEGWESVGAVAVFTGVLLAAVFGTRLVQAAIQMASRYRVMSRRPGRIAVTGE